MEYTTGAEHLAACLAHVLSLEVQDNIFSFCSSGDLARCARVCKSWSSASLDRVWYSQKGLANLFRVLAPLKPIFSHGSIPSHIDVLVFARVVVHTDWKRFEIYAARIRNLEIPHTSETSELLDAKVLSEIVMEKPASMPNLLPNLKQLHIWGQTGFGYPWISFFKGVIHGGLRELGLFFTSKTYNVTADFLLELAPRTPGLTTLHIWTSLKSFDQAIETHIGKVISSFPALCNIYVPSCLLTPGLLSYLHRHPNLRKINIVKASIRTGRAATGLLPPPLPVGAFQKLSDLTLLCSLSELNQYLSSGVVCACLEDLLIDVVSQPKAPIFRACLVRIAEAFPILTSLVITRREDLSVIVSKRDEIATLALQDLEALPRMKHLRNVEIHHTDIISMSDDDLASLLSHCPSLSNAYLNSKPIFPSATQLSLNLLPLLAKKCPQLEALSLYIDGTKAADASDGAELHTFKNLYYIDFGSSPVFDEDYVIEMLAQVLPLECEFSTTSVFSSDLRKALDKQALRVMDANHAEWKKIAIVLPSLIKTRIITERRFLKAGRIL